MKVPLRWLETYVTIALPIRALAEKLTMSGSLVESVTNSAAQWDQILVARVLTLVKHPNADSLWLATVDLGDRQQTLVTGAPNLSVGVLVPYIAVGLRLPGQEKPLEGKVIRGIRSEGMVCSGKELGINDDHGGILILDQLLDGRLREDEDPVGKPLSDYLGEWVLDLEITPNRPDCLSVVGVAREVAAVTGATLREPIVALAPSLPPAGELASVRIDAPDLCTRYVAQIITGVRVGPSPAWLAERLQAAGMRAINNVVDVTNYVMLELGQPLHPFDLDLVSGRGIVVRRAHEGELLTTLDGIQRTLTGEMLIIADASPAGSQPVGVAGVMGGGNSEVSEATTSILLEAATFQGRSVRRTARGLGLRTEASSRLEKGLPRQLASLAAARAAALIAELAGGTVAAEPIEVGEPDPQPRRIPFLLGEVERLLGVDWPAARIIGNLEALGFGCEQHGGGALEVTVPWWRGDVVESADLVEEVARVTGFDAIPETLLRGSVPPRPASSGLRWREPARQVLLAAGLSEGCSPGLAGERSLELLRPEGTGNDWLRQVVPNPEAVSEAGALFEVVRIINPLSPERELLRPTLLPALIEALRDNLRAGEASTAFFELDFCTFKHPSDLPFERRTLALAMAGDRRPPSWATPAQPLDFFDLKGVVEALIERLCVHGARLETARDHLLLHPGRAATLAIGERLIGFFGELHPAIAARWDLGDRRAYVAEFDFDALAAHATNARSFVEFPRVPVAKRDLAVVVEESRTAAEILSVIRDSAKDLLAGVTLFDVYRGDQLPTGRKSLAFAVDLQASNRTLSEDEVEKAMGRIRRALAHRVGAAFRE